jgi:negative regulator of flagellin synthesis FlgM
MRINSAGAEFIRPTQTAEVQRGAEENAVKKATAQPTAPVERGDKVEISDVARKLAASAKGADETSSTREAFTPERVAMIREKILSGAYNSVEMVDQVARKMLASGDI